MPDTAPRRSVRSFVMRAGRVTPAQQYALAELLPRYRVCASELSHDFNRRFPRRAPLYLEIGSGNGENAVALAGRCPDIELLASEVHPPGLGHTVLEVQRHGLANLHIFDRDVHDLLSALPPAALDVVLIFFPDPWPKKRHHKRRLVGPALLDLLALRLKRHGRIYFATDNEDYALSVRAAVAASPAWINLAGPGNWAPRPHARYVTRFEQRARIAGRTIYELVFALDRLA